MIVPLAEWVDRQLSDTWLYFPLHFGAREGFNTVLGTTARARRSSILLTTKHPLQDTDGNKRF